MKITPDAESKAMKRLPENPKNNTDENQAPKTKSDGWAAFLFMGTAALALGSANMLFLNGIDKAQDQDPVLVLPVVERSVENLGYSNVRFQTFNKAADKPAHITFTAEKDTIPYSGEADCTARSCSRVSVSINFGTTPGA